MYYKEFLRARNTVVVFAIITGILWAVTAILTLVLPGGGSVTIDDGGNTARVLAAHAAAKALQTVPWPALFGGASLLAAIIATVLGSTLSQENDGHLELALTKPYSRVAYASTVMGVDLIAIFTGQLIVFAAIVSHFLIFHCKGCYPGPTELLVNGPEPFFNAIRFALFPLAWYAIIVGLSAGLRGKAGIVQGLIWPIALGLTALRHVPASGGWQMWHGILTFLSLFNPLVYVSYQDQASDATIQIVGAGNWPAMAGAVVLALFIVAGWAGALVQWRRVEA